MWKCFSASAAGTSHQATGLPCQDSSGHRITGLRNDGDTLIAVVADGAGSAPWSHIGSGVVASGLSDIVLEHLRRDPTATPTRLQVLAWFHAVRRRLRRQADALGCTPRELASTCLLVVASDTYLISAQVGDGIIGLKSTGDVHGLAFWPIQHEYANATAFLTDSDWKEHLQLAIVAAPMSEIFICSDGIQKAAAVYANQTLYLPFVEPLQHAAQRNHGREAREVVAALQDFLASDAVNALTDDDKTILLALRVS